MMNSADSIFRKISRFLMGLWCVLRSELWVNWVNYFMLSHVFNLDKFG